MAQSCSRCGRANPDEAIYCYQDGSVLAGRTAQPLHTSLRPFPHPLAFPSGRPCLNFEQLLRCCQEDWASGVTLLRRGELERFFITLGRIDLAQAAREAATAADADRGLDELLGRLPSQEPPTPRLRVTPRSLDLGTLRPGEDCRVEITLGNEGARLLYGSVTSDAVWLALGDAPGAANKVFQFSREQTMTVWVRGQQLRASRRPLEAQLAVESNGGSATVRVRAMAPPEPFPQGVLAGAASPRELVEKLRGDPRGAADLFDSGAVAEWYARNNWPYPVPGPSAAGLDGVRQFLKALGLPDDLPADAVGGPAAPLALPAAGPPIPPSADDILATITNPRQFVEKVRTTPNLFTPLFDRGAVAARYAANGWDYPVHGPSAAGIDAVYQFLKAAGAALALPASPRIATGPFPEGVLAGAVGPRELIEKVKAAPADAAPLFDSGAVAAWYEANGWSYPVRGPRAAGIDAIYQFLKSVGGPAAPVAVLVNGPAVPTAKARPGERAIHLRGRVGEQIQHVLSAKSKSGRSRPARARASSDQPWLDIGETRLDDAGATIVLLVPAVPDRPGETLHARVQVVVNDAQSFVVPVTLSVGDQSSGPS